ncbi:hypothetical protein H4W81_006456 [Nonomuraea africana]|uniref:Uncharacterized protein n=1 Tax=Nonomuraea africana TaxID=46171 RepID=A0ABR9KNU1_9ACTN|nr:hypothetical protein [Nonomuraea africana]
MIEATNSGAAAAAMPSPMLETVAAAHNLVKFPPSPDTR